MTVINPNSISGITSITLPAGGDNVLTIHTNDGVERFRIDSSGNIKVGSAATISPDGDVFFTGVCTATTLSGDGSALTGIAATDNVRTGILDVAGIATFRNNVNVGTAVTISESGIEASGIGITVANINGGQIGGRRNIIINGAMNVAQRGTSSTSTGYQTVDRFTVLSGATDETPTQAQVDLTSSDTPYSLGFRKALKITNGNQSSGAGASDYIEMMHKFEGQDIHTSGWDFTSTSSFITISFWIKSSVAQTFYGAFRITEASANKQYTFAINATTSWQKITKTMPGASGLNPVNTNALGGWFNLIAFYGTSFTGSMTLDQWNTVDTNAYVPDMTSTWYATNDATLEITGVQLEVGSQATPFEHRSFGEELDLCQRYYQRWEFPADKIGVALLHVSSTTTSYSTWKYFKPLRSSGSDTSFSYSELDDFDMILDGNYDRPITGMSMSTSRRGQYQSEFVINYNTAGSNDECASLRSSGSDGWLAFSAEL